jgi:hypothetical protein
VARRTLWWLLADARDAKPIGWVPAGDHMKVVDCSLNLLLEMDGKEDEGITLKGKIPLSKK